jgi:ketosteroid isomerase-like protein
MYRRAIEGMSAKTVSRRVFYGITALLVIVLIAVAGYSYYSLSSTRASISSLKSEVSTLQSQLNVAQVESLALQHWSAIGTKNLTATMSQYSQNAVLYWVVAPTGALNGTYTGMTAIQSTWAKFFAGTPTTYYTIYNLTISLSGNTAVVKATLWYVLGGGKVTLKLPYELNYEYQSNSWMLTAEWWGLPNNPGTAALGVLPT